MKEVPRIQRRKQEDEKSDIILRYVCRYVQNKEKENVMPEKKGIKTPGVYRFAPLVANHLCIMVSEPA